MARIYPCEDVPSRRVNIVLGDGTIMSDPEVLTPDNVMYYSHHAKEVKGTLRSKAQKFLDLGLVEWDRAAKNFYVHFIPGYNTRTYEIVRRAAGFECNCQGCQTKIKKGLYDPDVDSFAACSHILAVYLWLKMVNWNKNGGENGSGQREE